MSRAIGRRKAALPKDGFVWYNRRMKKLIPLACSVLVPVVLNAGVWANLDDDHWYSGPKLAEKDLEGKVVIVDNWGVNCPPCRALLPRMQELWTHFDQKKFVLVGSHCQGRKPEKVKELVDENKLTFPIYERFGLAEGAPKFSAIPFLYVVNHRGRVVYSGHDEREATEALVTAIGDVGMPISLVSGVALPKRYKSFSKKMRLGASIAGDVKKLEKEAAGKNARMAGEAQAIIDAIEKARGEIKEEIAAARKRKPAEALKLMKDFLKTWPKEGAEYKADIAELQKQVDAEKAAAAKKK